MCNSYKLIWIDIEIEIEIGKEIETETEIVKETGGEIGKEKEWNVVKHQIGEVTADIDQSLQLLEEVY